MKPDFIKGLQNALKDEGYKMGWIANIAMSYIDNERWHRQETNKINKRLNQEDKHIIANKSAEHFVKMLMEDFNTHAKTLK